MLFGSEEVQLDYPESVTLKFSEFPQESSDCRKLPIATLGLQVGKTWVTSSKSLGPIP